MKPALRLTNPHSATTHYEPVADERAAVAYLDLGTGGYMDVGTDLTDEQLAALPKGRHMLAIIGTHGVNGYNPASAPVAGEAVTWEAVRQELAIFLMGATGRSSKEWHRPLDNASEGGALARMRACLAAPQASAEDVRKPIMTVAEFCTEADRIGLTADTLAAQLAQRPEFADCLPPADKDGGQQRKRYVVLKSSRSRYAYVNDTQEGRSINRFDVLKGDGWKYAHEFADRMNKEHERAALSATQAEQGERDE